MSNVADGYFCPASTPICTPKARDGNGKRKKKNIVARSKEKLFNEHVFASNKMMICMMFIPAMNVCDVSS